jgi:hypothetical protein
MELSKLKGSDCKASSSGWEGSGRLQMRPYQAEVCVYKRVCDDELRH